jgi:hypothetical protein
MTQEEAVEVILGGQAWDKCEACKGEGKIDDLTVGGIEQHTCGTCFGVGSLTNDLYTQARFLLKLEGDGPCPPRPLTRRERIAKALGVSTTERVKRLFNIKEVK